LSKAKIQLRNVTDFLQDSKVNLILGDLNLDYEKRRKISYQHRKIHDEWLLIKFKLSNVGKNLQQQCWNINP
jgi:hypothetical protein